MIWEEESDIEKERHENSAAVILRGKYRGTEGARKPTSCVGHRQEEREKIMDLASGYPHLGFAGNYAELYRQQQPWSTPLP